MGAEHACLVKGVAIVFSLVIDSLQLRSMVELA